MTPPSRPSRSREVAAAAVLLTFVAVARPRRAEAQACCAGGSIVTPTRLALQEDAAVGVQLRARSNHGAFDAAGQYATSSGAEQIVEQDFAASFRLGGKGQVAAVMPIVQTHRSVGGLDDWGGGLGDVSMLGRYELSLPAQALYWPGFGLLAAATLPTGTPPDGATHPLSADATGNGTYDVTVGVDVEKAVGPLYVALDGWLTHRFARTVSTPVGALRQSFGTRWTLLAVASYVFDSEASAGLYVSVFDEGPSTVDGIRDATTKLRQTTVGCAGVLPLDDRWRLQGALFADVPLSSLGRNEPAGGGVTAALVRAWP